MKLCKKIISFVLCFAIVISMLVLPASAEWNVEVGYYGAVTMEALEEKLLFENGNNEHKLRIKYDSALGAFRLCYIDGEEWYLNTQGTYPYVLADGDTADEPGADVAAPPSVSRNKFVNVKDLNLENLQLVILTQDALAESVRLINEDIGSGVNCTMTKAKINGADYWVIMKSAGTQAAYYCNSSGMPYVALAESSATDIKYDYIDNTDNSTTINDSQIIQIEDGILNIIDDNGDKIQLTIDSLTFDTGTKNYTVNAYNTTYEGDTSYYTYYTYNITYNITNTYVTYIGSNDAYEKEECEYYYQLPDGRSSADLTADEVAGMSFEFYDVVNYAKSATDVSVRALYHFDGDTDDSSYFSTQGSFTWEEGASITYMEAPAAFDGALYLGPEKHSFAITLPSNLGSGDFSLQFRYYHAAEPDTRDNVENVLSIGGTDVLKWDETNFYNGSGSLLCAIANGTWQELAVVRHSGTLYLYHNGICIGSLSCALSSPGEIAFTFGDTSRAYSMLDELRVVNFAIAEGGVSYTPTAVPFDSNLVLVLPDSSFPVADEYWDVKSSDTNLLGFTLNDFLSGVDTDNFSLFGTGISNYDVADMSLGQFYYTDSSMAPVYYTEGVVLSSDGSISYNGSGLAIGAYHQFLGFYSGDRSSWHGNGIAAGDYTFSVVLSDGSVSSHSFTIGSSLDGFVDVPSSFDWGSVQLSLRYNDNLYRYQTVLSLVPSSTIQVVYMELVEGSSTDLTAEWVTCIYSSEDIKPNTAAVQSDIPVNGYTVGGVRPTLPARGDVWFPVAEGRIQTCYIYTGSMWEEVGCRWYTGSRWIPIYAFDLVTLEDLFDIADAAEAVVPITSESAFWRWWQLQWLDFRDYLDRKFDELITAITGKPAGSGADCEHQYSSEVTSAPGCAEPGYRTYTCSECGHQYTEIIDATGHDWICTNSVSDVLDEEGNVVEQGYDELTCSVCGATAKDYGDGPEENDLFDALGDFIASGISWVLDKLTELVEALTGITDIFSSFAERIQAMAGEYPAFFGAFVALIPEELSALMWFAVTAFVVIAVWKKWSR